MRVLLLLASVAAMAAPVLAQPEQSAARAVGQIGERFDGYVGIVGTVSPTVRNQVNAINIKRRALYSQLGSRRGVAPGDVGITAGCELLGRVQIGEAYMLQDGRWRRRAAGESAPRPDYCG